MKRHIGLLLLAALSVVSCNKEGEIFYREGEQKTEEATVTRALQNASDPFAIDAMQQALDLVAADDPSVPRITLQPTGYYVKFNPQDSVQMATLDGLGIELFSHPLDNGIYPETEPEEVTEDTPIVYEPLYAVVPAGFVFPEEVDYELIHGVFIQNKRGPASDEGQLPAGVYASVLDASLRLTGNVSSARSTVQPFQPSARLRFEITDKSGYGINNDTLPLVGAKVLAFYYTDVSWGVTDDNGETGPICTTNTPVRYEVHWGDDRWNVYIANKNKKRISILDGTHTGPVDVVFADGTWEGVMSGMHTALYSYFYRDYPLTRYLIKGDYTLDIATMTKGGRSSAAPVRPLREIYFYGKYKGASRYHTPEKAMNTMFHELGHISHHKLEPLKFIVRALRKDGESWATGVEYAYMKSFFPEYTDPNNRGEKNKYTRVVECLLKNGFSMGDIQHGFHESGGWDSWQVEMRRIVTGRTDMTDDEKERLCEIVNIIFSHPNDAALDLRDIVEAEYESVGLNQLVRLRLNEDARALSSGPNPFISIEGWEIADSDGVSVPHQYTDNSLFVYFTRPGRKKIRLTANVFGGERVYEKELNVGSQDIVERPADPIVGREEVFKLRQTLTDAGVEVKKWASGDNKTELLSFPSNVPNGRFRFTEKGERTVKVTVYYPTLRGTVEYEIKTLVRDPESDEIFYILNPPELFAYDTTYRAMYGVVGEKITGIERIECDHCHYLFYLYFDDSWSFDRNSGVLSFSIPKHGTYLDYCLTIFYTVESSDDVREAGCSSPITGNPVSWRRGSAGNRNGCKGNSPAAVPLCPEPQPRLELGTSSLRVKRSTN